MNAITRDQLIRLFKDQRGATIMTFVARTEPKMRKTNNPFSNVTKVARVNGMTNFQYDAGVQRRLEKENKSADDFRKGTSWHQPVLSDDGKLTALCEHKKTGALYVRFLFVQSVSAEYFADGQPIDVAELEPWLVRSTYANQGLDKPLVFLTYAIDNIESVTLDNKTLAIADNSMIAA